tara:strand:- start:196 stop:798 length:603 start_codon:yes stop_codon:yes gene_type:complete
MHKLYTVGHSTQELESFLGLLKQHGIEAVADVRSGPYSQRFPWFNREQLAELLKQSGIQYVFMGVELGARRDEPCCYVGAKADYELIAQCELFQKGLERVQQGLKQMRVALMCAEKDPMDCHRTILVARHATAFTEVAHILNDGTIETHAELEARLLKKMGMGVDDLFLSHEEQLEIAYKQRGDQIAYRKDQSEEFENEH